MDKNFLYNNHVTVDCSHTVVSYNNNDSCINYCENNCNKESNNICYINTDGNKWDVIKINKNSICKIKRIHNPNNMNYKSYKYIAKDLPIDPPKQQTCGCSTDLSHFDNLTIK